MRARDLFSQPQVPMSECQFGVPQVNYPDTEHVPWRNKYKLTTSLGYIMAICFTTFFSIFTPLYTTYSSWGFGQVGM